MREKLIFKFGKYCLYFASSLHGVEKMLKMYHLKIKLDAAEVSKASSVKMSVTLY